MELDPHIRYIIVVPDWKPEEATPFQGFAFSLCKNAWMVRAASLLPSMIYDLAEAGRETFLPRRMGGTNPVNWHGQSPRALRSIPWPAFLPFTVIMLDKSQDVSDYKVWIDSCEVPPTIVAANGGNLHYSELSIEGLQKRFLQVCDLIPDTIAKEEVQSARSAIEKWRPFDARSLGYQVAGHATVGPNLTALSTAGYVEMVSGPFADFDNGNKPYVDQIVRTSRSILEERSRIGDRDADRIFRRPPDINVFAPGMYAHFGDLRPKKSSTDREKKEFLAVRTALERQQGYNFQLTSPAQVEAMMGVREAGKDPSPHPMMRLRQLELRLGTECMGALAASEFSAVVRLPNDINRTAGAVRQFAAHYRGDKPDLRKRLLAFRQVQSRISQAVPKEIIEIVRSSQSGVRIVADAHVEWLDIDGLPLLFRKNVARIPVTPGNLFVEQTCAVQHVWLSAESFRKVLVISALKRDDPIAKIFEIAFDSFGKAWKDKLTVEFVEVSSEEDLVEALNNFDGPMLIFDGHGTHAIDKPAVLFLKDKPIDIWMLMGRGVRVPPIVILSACDTHAADRNHATTANGFLSLGSRAVLGSVFPLHAVAAATFAARLIFRVSDFIPAAIGLFDRALTWLEIVSGMLRMQLLTDFLRLLERRGHLTEAKYHDVHVQGNFAINSNAEDAFEQILSLLVKDGLARGEVERALETAIANSSTISYLHLGRPETILVDREDRIERQLALEAPPTGDASNVERLPDV